MENEFLQKIDLDRLQKETGLSLQGIADLAEVSAQTIYRWSWDKSKQGNRPSFNAFVRLLQKGATVETLFGVEYAKMHPTQGAAPSEFLEGLKESDPESALNALVERKVLEMKANGKI